MPNTPEIIFYINLGFALCIMVELTATVLMLRKTAFDSLAGETAVILYCIGLASFVAQLVFRLVGGRGFVYAVLVACGIMSSSFIVGGVYRFLLGRRSNPVLCAVSGILSLLPPVGTAFSVILLKRLRFDTHAEQIVFNGFAYTFAVLDSVVGRFRAEYIDGSGEVHFDELDKKSASELLKKLKKKAKTPEGCYEYGNALISYRPEKYGLGMKMIKKAAKGDYPAALFNLGYCYEKGSGVKKDRKKAHKLYNRAALLGDEDAALRLGIVNIQSKDKADGVAVFRERAEKGDLCAKYNLGVCYERGDGVKADYKKAVSLYYECVSLAAAQRRLFSLACDCIEPIDISAETYKTDRFTVTACRDYEGSLALMMNGLIAIYDKQAADAAGYFLEAVKRRGMWEGIARCLVGALYMDCGASVADRKNGAAYVRSAFSLTPIAKELYVIIPKNVINGIPEKKKKTKSR
ncbi:MAG: sel1 repeat family protein [Clostridiales bacterium]|nr:sel1 repeat family protein [Clostridiales bacterium]